MTSPAGHLVAVGLGYTACRVAVRWAARGAGVTGTARSADAIAAIERQGYRAALFDGNGPSEALAAALAGASHLLVSAPPGATGDPLLAAHSADVRAAVAGGRLGAVVYLSTIGVYGDHGGAWIDEATPVAPASERSRRRVDAEAAWLRLGGETGCPVVVLRLPGIYGPGRSAIEQLRAGTARRIVKPGQVFNRAHVDDIAAAVLAALDKAVPQQVINVTDDEPAPPQDVVAYAARLLGLPVPPEVAFADAALSPMARSFYAESKRVANQRMKDVLGVRLAYPTYREGLAALARAASGAAQA